MNPPTYPVDRHFRAHARRPVNLRATAIAGGGSWQRAGRLVDLGLGGARIQLDEAIPVGSPVALLIDAPHRWEPLAIDALVAWVGDEPDEGGTYLGLKFPTGNGALLLTLTELLEAAAYG